MTKLLGDIPFIVISQHKNIAEEIAAFAQGAEDYVVYPRHQGVLLARIRVVLRHFTDRLAHDSPTTSLEDDPQVAAR
jgi:DNA-binding response OmpR family regulator